MCKNAQESGEQSQTLLLALSAAACQRDFYERLQLALPWSAGQDSDERRSRLAALALSAWREQTGSPAPQTLARWLAAGACDNVLRTVNRDLSERQKLDRALRALRAQGVFAGTFNSAYARECFAPQDGDECVLAILPDRVFDAGGRLLAALAFSHFRAGDRNDGDLHQRALKAFRAQGLLALTSGEHVVLLGREQL